MSRSIVGQGVTAPNHTLLYRLREQSLGFKVTRLNIWQHLRPITHRGMPQTRWNTFGCNLDRSSVLSRESTSALSFVNDCCRGRHKKFYWRGSPRVLVLIWNGQVLQKSSRDWVLCYFVTKVWYHETRGCTSLGWDDEKVQEFPKFSEILETCEIV